MLLKLVLLWCQVSLIHPAFFWSVTSGDMTMYVLPISKLLFAWNANWASRTASTCLCTSISRVIISLTIINLHSKTEKSCNNSVTLVFRDVLSSDMLWLGSSTLKSLVLIWAAWDSCMFINLWLVQIESERQEDLECLCKLFSTIGKQLDAGSVSSQQQMQYYFSCPLPKLSKLQTLEVSMFSPRIIASLQSLSVASVPQSL